MRGQPPCSFFIYINGPRGLTPRSTNRRICSILISIEKAVEGMRGQPPCSFFICVNGLRGLTPWPKPPPCSLCCCRFLKIIVKFAYELQAVAQAVFSYHAHL